MVKPLTFKGDKKPKKRKRGDAHDAAAGPATRKGHRADDDKVTHDDDSWVAAEATGDVNGPVMIVLPTEKPSALACDANGKVFSREVENIVDGNPMSAEPHEVSQVWVANRVSGTEMFRFKGHHGRYLSCDKIGLLSATSEAVSPLECFNVIATLDTPGTFQLQTQWDTFLTVAESPRAAGGVAVEIRGDADATSFSTTVRIRMQARFKPRLKASKEEKALAKISRKELEQAVGRRLDEEEVRMLKRARREGDYHERLLDVKVKSKHDKFG